MVEVRIGRFQIEVWSLLRYFDKRFFSFTFFSFDASRYPSPLELDVKGNGMYALTLTLLDIHLALRWHDY